MVDQGQVAGRAVDLAEHQAGHHPLRADGRSSASGSDVMSATSSATSARVGPPVALGPLRPRALRGPGSSPPGGSASTVAVGADGDGRSARPPEPARPPKVVGLGVDDPDAGPAQRREGEGLGGHQARRRSGGSGRIRWVDHAPGAGRPSRRPGCAVSGSFHGVPASVIRVVVVDAERVLVERRPSRAAIAASSSAGGPVAGRGRRPGRPRSAPG